MEDTATKRLIMILTAAMLVFAYGHAAAEQPAIGHNDSHRTEERARDNPAVTQTGSNDTHHVAVTYDLYCLDCGRVIQANFRTEDRDEEHTWGTARIEPTCEDEGEQVSVCTVCGAISREKIPALGHQYAGAAQLMRRQTGTVQGGGEFAGKTIGEVITAPTCTENGSGILICARCQDASQTVSIPALGHEWGEWEDVTEPPETACITDVRVARRCLICAEEEIRTVSPAPGHQWSKVAYTEATCTETGTVLYQCSVCGAEKMENTPALGHTYADAALLAKQPEGEVAGSGENAGKVIGRVISASTCRETGRGTLLCLRCQEASQTVTIPMGEHRWGDWTEEKVPPELICVTDVTGTRECLDCGKKETEVISPAPGHKWVAVSYQEPTCTEDGKAVRQCSVCGAEETFETPAMGHSFMWVDISTPSPTAKGIRECVCTECGYVAESKSVAYAQMYYNNTITSFGPMVRELIGGSSWYRVTPLDLSVDGVFNYPLVASNLYTVGTATVVIDEGVQTVSYRLNSSRITVHSESLILYPNLEALRTGENAVSVAFNDPIVLTKYFGGDTHVIMAITIRADYDAMAGGIQSFNPDQKLIEEMTGLID